MVGQQILQPHTYHCYRCTCHVHKKHQLQKGVVNGAIVTITSIIFDFENNIIAIEVQLTTNSIKMILKKLQFNPKIHMMDIIIKRHFQSHWHMLLLATNHRHNN
jgi:hypothetical protein